MNPKKEWNDYRKKTWPEGLTRRGARYRYRRLVQGTHYIKNLEAISEEDAVRTAQRYNFDIMDGVRPFKTEKGVATTVEAFAQNVWLPKKKAEVRPRSYNRYRSVVDNFLSFLKNGKGHSTPLEEVDYNTAADYIRQRAIMPIMPNGKSKFTRALKNGAAKRTLHNERAVLSQLFREAVRRKLISENPFDSVRTKKPGINETIAVHHPLTVHEEQALLKAAAEFDADRLDKDNPRLCDILLFLIKTGLRLDEMINLVWTDVDFEERLIHIREKQIVETRTVPLSESVLLKLTEHLKGRNPGDLVFQDEKEIQAFGLRLKIREPNVLLGLRVEEVDLAKRDITTQRRYAWKPKGTQGVVPMCAIIYEMLKGMKEASTGNYVFSHFDGGRCRMRLLEMLKKVQIMAGIRGNLRIHDMRHTLAVRLRQAGVRLETIMGVMRHADIRETMIYAPYSLNEGHDAMRLMDVVPATIADANGG